MDVSPQPQESYLARIARRTEERPAREHYYQTRHYARLEFPTTTSAACDRVTMDLLHEQAAAEDATRG